MSERKRNARKYAMMSRVETKCFKIVEKRKDATIELSEKSRL